MRTAQLRHFNWLAFALGMAVCALVACTAEVPGQPVEGDDPRAALRGQFNRDVLPLMQATCAACHAGSRQFIDWMAPLEPDFPTEYDRVMSWPALVNIEDPAQSRLVTKGGPPHEGPAWTPEQLNIINPWLQAEADFGGTGEEIDTTEVTPLNGPNMHDLGDLGIPDAAGCILSYDFERSDPVLYLSNLLVTDTSGDGCILESPVIGVVLDSGTYYDPNNRFGDVTVDVGPNASAPVGGTLSIISWLDPTDLANSSVLRLKFRFFGVQPTGTGGEGGGGGAQLIDYFYDNVVPCITGLQGVVNCQTCHGGGAAQQGAIDLSGLASTDMTERQNQANEIFLRSDRADPGVVGGDPWILKVDPAGPAHSGGKVNNQGLLDACYQATSGWITMETTQ